MATSKPGDFWSPQPGRQTQLIEACGLLDALQGGEVYPAICERIGYGGAAGGGKSEGLLGVGFIACMMIPGVRVGYFRRTFTELEGSDGPIDRSYGYFGRTGARYNQSKHVWTWASKVDLGWDEEEGPALRFCHCEHEADVHSYQSWAFDILLIDEAATFSWYIIDHLIARLRPSKYSKIPHVFSVMSANPGGVGHIWYMQTMGIDPTRPLKPYD